jgi:hypothetical protein
LHFVAFLTDAGHTEGGYEGPTQKKGPQMGRIATVAIIALALGGATVESFAADAVPAVVQTAPQIQTDGRDHGPMTDGTPIGQLLADADAPSPPGAPGGDGQMPPPPPPMGFGAPDHGPGMEGPGMMPPPPRFMMERMRHMEATWGLFFNQGDKNLSNGDVQVLAQAILVAHGNHDWKVVNVGDSPDGRAIFAYATADGSVIARFAVDRHSGHLQRIG